jgi:thioredoxin 1
MAASNILVLTAENFQAQVLQSTKPVLVDFWAEWCGPCKMIGPVLDELAAEFDGKVSIGKINVDEQQALASQFGIQGIPTLLIFKGGQVIDQVVGLRGKKDLQSRLERAIA